MIVLHISFDDENRISEVRHQFFLPPSVRRVLGAIGNKNI